MEPERCFYNRLSFPPCKTVPGPLTAIKLLFHRCHGALAFHCACVKFLAGTQLHHFASLFFFFNQGFKGNIYSVFPSQALPARDSLEIGAGFKIKAAFARPWWLLKNKQKEQLISGRADADADAASFRSASCVSVAEMPLEEFNSIHFFLSPRQFVCSWLGQCCC